MTLMGSACFSVLIGIVGKKALFSKAAGCTISSDLRYARGADKAGRLLATGRG